MTTSGRCGRPLTFAVLVAVLAAALLAGCGDDSSAGTSSDPSTAAEASSVAPADAAAQSVTVTRSGGIAGERTTYRVTADDPHADKVLALTEEPGVFEDLPSTGQAPCCDFYTYAVVVDYAQGRDYRFVTWQDADAPRQVEQLVGAVTAEPPGAGGSG